MLGLLLLWELSARSGLVVSNNWPPVSAILAAAVRDFGKGELLGALGGTLYRMAVGFGLGAATAMLLGIVLSLSRPLVGRSNRPLNCYGHCRSRLSYRR